MILDFVVSIGIADNQTVQPYKYYGWKGECIYRFQNKNNKYFLLLDVKGNIIFQSQEIGFIEDLNSIEIDNRVDFVVLFDDMVKNPTQDKFFLPSLYYLKNYNKKCPIVLGGCGRSGTTLLLSILGAHNQIYSIPGESFSFTPKPFRLSIIKNSLKNISVEFNKRRWCEKTPKNVTAFRDIYNLFDGHVKLVHIIRDGRNVVTSSHPNHKYKKYWVDVERWVNDTSAGLSCCDIVYAIRYEDLVSYPKEQLKKLCEYLEEDFDEQLLKYYEKTTVISDPGWVGGPSPISNHKLDRWKNEIYKERIDEFMKNNDAVNLLKKLGYL